MRRKKLRIFACVLLALTVLTAFAALAGGVGSQDDPLVTPSYLNDTFTGQVLEKVDKALVLEALRAVLKDPEATTAQRLFAVAVLDHMQHYYFVPSDTRHLLQTADAAKIDAEIAERLEQLKNK